MKFVLSALLVGVVSVAAAAPIPIPPSDCPTAEELIAGSQATVHPWAQLGALECV